MTNFIKPQQTIALRRDTPHHLTACHAPCKPPATIAPTSMLQVTLLASGGKVRARLRRPIPGRLRLVASLRGHMLSVLLRGSATPVKKQQVLRSLFICWSTPLKSNGVNQQPPIPQRGL